MNLMEAEEEVNANSAMTWVSTISSSSLQGLSIRVGLLVTKHLVSWLPWLCIIFSLLMLQTCFSSMSMQLGVLYNHPPISNMILVNSSLVHPLAAPNAHRWIHTDNLTSKGCPTPHLLAVYVITNPGCLSKKLWKVIWNTRVWCMY